MVGVLPICEVNLGRKSLTGWSVHNLLHTMGKKRTKASSSVNDDYQPHLGAALRIPARVITTRRSRKTPALDSEDIQVEQSKTKDPFQSGIAMEDCECNDQSSRSRTSESFKSAVGNFATENSIKTHLQSPIEEQPKEKPPLPHAVQLKSFQEPKALVEKIDRIPTIASSFIPVSDDSLLSPGHMTIIWETPVIEGNYYLEVQVHQSQKDQNIRMGLTNPDHPRDMPVGVSESVGFNFLKNSFYYGGKPMVDQGGPQRKQISNFTGQTDILKGDIFGLEVNFTPPGRMTNSPLSIYSEQPWEGSYIQVSKNGEPVARLNYLKSRYQCIGISVFNCEFRVLAAAQQLHYRPKNSQPISQLSRYQCPYAPSSLNLPNSLLKLINFTQ